MGKERNGTREGKKKAVLTQKEKKVAKQVKKQEKSAVQPLIPTGSFAVAWHAIQGPSPEGSALLARQ